MTRNTLSAVMIGLVALTVGGGSFQAALCEEAMNLIKNPGFDNDMSGWVAERKMFPDGVTCALDAAVKKGEGGNSLKLSTTPQIITRLIQKTDFAVMPGETYALSAWVKTSGAVQACVLVKLGGAYLGTNYKLSAGPDFKKVEMTFVVPEGVTSLQYIALYLKGSDGSVWFDDVSLTKLP